MGTSGFRRLIAVSVAVAALAVAAPSFGGPLQREERAEADAQTVEPGQVSALVRRYRGGIALAAVLETLAAANGGYLTRSDRWTREDVEAVVVAATRAQASPTRRLAIAGYDAHAHARFLLVERGQLAAMLDDPTIDPISAAWALYWNGHHRGQIRRDPSGSTKWTFEPADQAAVRRLLERLVADGRPASTDAARTLLREIGDRALWYPEISAGLAETALDANWRDERAVADAAAARPESKFGNLGFKDTDFWVAIGLGAAPGTSLRARAEEIRGLRCERSPVPTTFACDGSSPPPPQKRVDAYDTGFRRTMEWTTCPVEAGWDHPVALGRDVHALWPCASLMLPVRSLVIEHAPRLVNDRGQYEDVQVDDRVCDTHRRVLFADPELVVLEPSSADPNNCWKTVYTRASAPPVHWSRCDGVPRSVSGPVAQSPPVACADLVLETVNGTGPTPGYTATLLDGAHHRYRVSPGDVLCDGWRVRDIAPGRVVLDAATDGPNCFQAAK